jgi:hypothetical protein
MAKVPTMGSYLEAFSVGSQVRVADRPALEEFRSTWHLHNPLQESQLEFAGRTAAVTRVGFYHGGDVLYELEGVPGIWHEQCLAAI